MLAAGHSVKRLPGKISEQDCLGIFDTLRPGLDDIGKPWGIQILRFVDNDRVNTGPIWWEVRPILVMFESDWPSADGSRGITSSKEMDAVEAAGRAVEVGSTFFLFFSSEHSSMNGMNH